MTRFDDVKHQTTEDYFNGNKFSIDAFNKKYASFEGETYVQALKRVCGFVASMEPTEELKKYWADRWFDEIYNDWWHPAGSIMQGAGSGKKISLANCFSRDTEFVTDKGAKSFYDFADGDEVNALTNYGGFIKSKVKKYSPQKLKKLTIQRNGFYKEIKCTDNHLWRTLQKETIVVKETKDLSIGDVIPYIKRKWMKGANDNRYFCPLGFIHGLTFGDGTYYKEGDYCNLDLCGDSKQFLKYFKGFDWVINDSDEDKIRILYLPNYMKQMPDFEKINSEYILGFLIGWFAADGTIGENGGSRLCSSKIEQLIEIKKVIQSLGIYTTEIRKERELNPFNNSVSPLYGLYFVKDCLFESFFVKENHKEKYQNYINNLQKDKSKVNWKVVDVEETDLVEEVWCLEVPEVQNFTLADGVNTHNCVTISLGLLKEDEEWDNLESIIRNTAYSVAKSAAYRQGLGIDFCLSPETLILTSDLRQIPVKDINIGDELIGFDENLNLDKNRLKPSVVKSKDVIKRPSYKITTDRGYVIASAEHLWVSRNGKEKPDGRMACKYEWVATDNLKVGHHIAFSIEPWEEQTSKDAGYLSGLLDGEGWVSKSHSGIGQNEGIVYNKIIELFDFFKIKYNVNEGKKCKKITTNGKWESIKLLGMFRPPRLLSKSKLLWEDKKLTGQKNPYAKIINIEFLGEKEVVALGTSTQTLIANGFLSHNSRLRPSGAKVLNSANESTGAVHWMKFIDSIAYFVGQKGRIPAFLISLNISHPDIEEFITVKSDYTKIQNANISVQISDAFYRAVEADKDWELRFEVPGIKAGDKIWMDDESKTSDCYQDTETKRWYRIAQFNKKKELITKKVSARKLMELVAKNMYTNAEPGIQNIDIARKYSNSDYVYNPKHPLNFDSRIISTNACSEQYLDRNGTCILSSINAEKFSINQEQYKTELGIVGESVNRFLDNVISCELEYHTYATHYQRMSMEELRRTGAGFTNLTGWLFKQNMIYGTTEGNEVSEEFQKWYNYSLYKSSINLGKEKGSFKSFVKEKYIQSPFIKRMMKEFPELTFDTMRNVTCSSIAPTGSLALMFSRSVLSYGIEPAFGIYYWKRTRISGKYEYYFCVPSIVREVFKSAGFEIPMKSDDIKDTWDGKFGKPIAEFIDKHKELIGIKFKNSTDIKAEDKLEMMSKVMKWVDSSISVTYMLPEKSTWKDVYNFIISAWKKEVKSIAAFPDRKMYGIVSFISFKDLAFKLKSEGVGIHAQNFTPEEANELHIASENITQSSAPKRPAELEADFYVVKVKEEKFIMAVGLLNGAPFEVFGGHMNGNGLNFKFTHKKGKIVKKKSGVYVAEIGDDLEADFSKVFNPVEKSLFRSLSTSLRHGVPVKFIVEQLQKAEDDMFSIGSATARVLKKYIADGEKVTGVQCPQCKTVGSLIYKDGCNECTNCGYSKCS